MTIQNSDVFDIENFPVEEFEEYQQIPIQQYTYIDRVNIGDKKSNDIKLDGLLTDGYTINREHTHYEKVINCFIAITSEANKLIKMNEAVIARINDKVENLTTQLTQLLKNRTNTI